MKQISQVNFKPQGGHADRATAERRQKSRDILRLLALNSRSGDTTPELAAIYHQAVDGESAETVRMAVDRFIRGEVEGHNLAFCPNPPQLAKECRRISVPAEAFRKVWKPTKVEQIEDRQAQERRRVALERAKTPEERLEIINRIRRKKGQAPFNPYDAAQRRHPELFGQPEVLGMDPGREVKPDITRFDTVDTSNADALLGALNKKGNQNDGR